MLDYFQIVTGKIIFKRKKKRLQQLGLFWRTNKIRNMRLPLLTSVKMFTVIGPWVPDLPGCCLTKWQVLSPLLSMGRGTGYLGTASSDLCGSLMQSGGTRSTCTFSLGKWLPGACSPCPRVLQGWEAQPQEQNAGKTRKPPFLVPGIKRRLSLQDSGSSIPILCGSVPVGPGSPDRAQHRVLAGY